VAEMILRIPRMTKTYDIARVLVLIGPSDHGKDWEGANRLVMSKSAMKPIALPPRKENMVNPLSASHQC
jgi:hypothetical protein